MLRGKLAAVGWTLSSPIGLMMSTRKLFIFQPPSPGPPLDNFPIIIYQRLSGQKIKIPFQRSLAFQKLSVAEIHY
jgi:hypothetical protein